jgi:hypothetical protein
MELSHQPPSSHPLTAPVHPPERVTGPPELHHSKGRYHLREPVETEVYFNLNVLVEYFAALFVLQSNTISGVREWQSISHRLEFVPIGFLVALRSCARFLNDSDVTEQLSTVIANRKAGLIPQVPSQQNPKENKIMETS